MSRAPGRREAAQRSENLRTGWSLAAVPTLFFAGTFAAVLSGAPDGAVAVLGVAGLLFVAQAIASHCLERR